MDIFIPILSAIAAAIGGFLGTYFKLKSEKNRHLFDHKINAYINLIKTYRNVVAKGSNEKSRQEYVSSQEQVALIASDEVISITEEFYEKSASDSPKIQARLVKAMRKDLGSNF